MNRLLITASAFTLLAVPVLAQSSKSNSEAASQAAARASGGFSGGNSFTNNFGGGSKIPNNTPDVIVSPGSVSGADCQLPGFALGGAIVGNGGALSIPGGTDEECKALTLAGFFAKLSATVSDRAEAQQYRQTSIDLTCQIPRMKVLRQCGGVAQPVVAAAYTPTYAPTVAAPAHVSQPTPTHYNYSYAQLQAQGWYCNEPDRVGYYPAVAVCSAWLAAQR